MVVVNQAGEIVLLNVSGPKSSSDIVATSCSGSRSRHHSRRFASAWSRMEPQRR